MPDIRDKIKTALAAFASQPVRLAAIELLRTIGYESERTIQLGDSSPQGFLDFVTTHAGQSTFDEAKALAPAWKSADLLFQLTDEELSRESRLFKDTSINAGLLRSYLFFAIELTGTNYPRGKLTSIARQLNRVFPMPVMVLIKHVVDKREVLSIAVINRRQHKRDLAKDVLGKVTIIRDIALNEPHRGHLDILASLALPNLAHPQRLLINNFDALHTAWEEIFNVELLNKKFYRDLANWYFWALPQVEFPDDIEKVDEKRRATSLIRLLTRLIFCWFLKEKGLIPEKLFNETDLKEILKQLKPDSCSYHQGILQNLFFGTLNQKMGKDNKGNPHRAFAKDEGFQKNKSTYGVDNLFRYEEHFRDPDTAIDHFAEIPFLNGGLFECLDRTEPKSNKKIYVDGFSRNAKKRPHVPNHLFFSEELSGIDLSESYGERTRRNESVRGLLRILSAYKFTIVENTPIDQEIALDPELLGKVFENLLASYNEETKTTARKQTGSFYTPRPIVEYMVDASLNAHLTTVLTAAGMKEDSAREDLENLFAYTEIPHPFTDREVDTLLDAIHTCKILDPACGSGAFPMGMMQKLVYIIHKLDPENAKWMQLQIDKAGEIPDPSARDAAIKAIEKDFADNEDDYGRKLYLIENCLYGVDIQPIAIQISKLRFFISLVCDQKTNRRKQDNHGIRPLPNLETRFVAADTLISLKKDPERSLFESAKVQKLESDLQRVRHDHFAATTRQKKLALQTRDCEIRDSLATELEQAAFWDQTVARKLADWDPYDPQASADYFEPLWMFDRSLGEGFDIVIGNPPYIQIQKFPKTQKDKWEAQKFTTYAAMADIYCLFYERGAQLLRSGGHLCFITSNKWMRAGYGEQLRDFLASKVNTTSVLDFGMAQNFGAATTYTCVTSFVKQLSARHTLSCYVGDTAAAMSEPAQYFASHAVPLTTLDRNPWVVLPPERHSIKKQVEHVGVPLESWKIQIYRGILTGFNDAFYLTQEQRDAFVTDDSRCQEFIVPLLRGRSVERYATKWDGTWMINSHNGIKERSIPAVSLKTQCPPLWHHLVTHEQQLRKRQDQGNHWSNLRNCAYLEEFSKPKIIYQEIAQKLPFYFDQGEQFFVNDTCYIITSQEESLTALTAILNSTVFRCCFKDNFPENAGNTYRAKKVFMDKIPIRKPTVAEISLFERLVPLIQFAKADVEASTGAATFFEDVIDACVMECYFREHMAERDLLFIDQLAPLVAAYDAVASDAKQRDFLTHLHGTLNAPSHPIRNQLIRLTADSPALLGVIKAEGKV